MNRPDAILYTISLALYFISFFGYILQVSLNNKGAGRFANWVLVLGILPHTAAFFARWSFQNHFPLANMFEYMGMMAWMVIAGLLYFTWRYRNNRLGVFITPVAIMLLVTASLLPSDINRQLMPALQSTWLIIHVTLAALGSGAFLISFAASSLYLIFVDSTVESGKSSNNIWKSTLIFWVGLPILITVLLNLFGILPPQVLSVAQANSLGLDSKPFTAFTVQFGAQPVAYGKMVIGLGIGMIIAAIFWPFGYIKWHRPTPQNREGSRMFTILILALLLSAVLEGFLIKYGIINLTSRSYLKIFEFFGPLLVFSWIITPILYSLLHPIDSTLLSKLHVSRPILEDISYSAVAIGYPLYTIGALFAGAIWAEQAWGTWWSWDPKETGALIIWLFYTGFLHARYQRQWKGERAAILVVLGMVYVFISFFGNYFFGGLHSFEVT